MRQFFFGALFMAGVAASMGAGIDRSQMQTRRQEAKALAAKLRAGTATPTEKDALLAKLAYIVLGEE